MEMSLEIAEWVLSQWDMWEEMYNERMEEDPEVFGEDEMETWVHDHVELEIYEDLEFEFDYSPDLGVSELIHLAEEIVKKM